MNALAKLIAQVLLLILPKLFDVLFSKVKKYYDDKKLKEENAEKGEAYENADSVSDARDAFKRLP